MIHWARTYHVAMHSKILILGVCSVSAALCFAAPNANASDNVPDRVKVYNVETGMTPPAMLPGSFADATGATCGKKNRTVFTTNIHFIVDAEGQARNLYFAQATATELDTIALRIAAADRFKPAMREGQPVATWAVLETEFRVCAEQKKVDGVKMETFHFMVPPIQTLKQGTQSDDEAILSTSGLESFNGGVFRVGGSVTPPVPILSPQAQFSDDARRKKISGICLVTTIVDANGMPQNPRIVRKLYPSLDEKALEAVRKYRFKPAMKGGMQPVPVMITIEVNFRLY